MTSDREAKAIPNDPVSTLARWIERKPESADTLRVVEQKLVRNDLVVEYTSDEVEKMGSAETAETILEECEVWAENKIKITPFTAIWIADSREVKTRHFKVFPESVGNAGNTGLPEADGSLEALIASLHANANRKDQILINMMESVVGLFMQLVGHMGNRIEHLESQEIEFRRWKTDILELTSGSNSDESNDQRLKTFINMFTKAIEASQASQAKNSTNPNPRNNPG